MGFQVILLWELQVAQGGVTGLQEDTHSLVAMALDAESRHSGAAGAAWRVCSQAMGLSQGQIRGLVSEQGWCGRVKVGPRSGLDSCRDQGWVKIQNGVKC